VLAVRSLFAYERDCDGSLVLGAGLAAEWIEGAGVTVRSMPTAYGPLSYSLRQIDADTLRFEIGARIAATVVLRPPLSAPLRSVMRDGAAHGEFDADSVTLRQTPAVLECRLA